jgi:hypothetical protein
MNLTNLKEHHHAIANCASILRKKLNIQKHGISRNKLNPGGKRLITEITARNLKDLIK